MNVVSRTAPLFGVLDSPTAGQAANSVLHSYGWLLQLVSSDVAIWFLINDHPVAASVEWVARLDVHQAHAHLVVDDLLPGFQALIDTSHCLAGNHTLTCQTVWRKAFGEQAEIISQAIVSVCNTTTPVVNAQFAARQSPQRAQQLIETAYLIHYHTFVLQSLRQTLWRAQADLKLPFEIAACADTLPESCEFVVVLRKT
jgi:hypothetical protein